MTGTSKPLPFTASPFRLSLQDLALFIRITFVWPPTKGLPSIVLPCLPFKSGPLDELYPSLPNLWAIFVHIFLVFFQLGFLLVLVPSVLTGIPLPLLGWTPLSISIITGVIVFNNWVTVLLNGTKNHFNSVIDPSWEVHEDEKWIFVNGVAVGSHWMQNNLDRIALTFRRPVMGIHNKTRGIIFDVIECIVQRTFGYATTDVRDLYTQLLNLVNEKQNGKAKWKKIVLILHSQGAIEGSLALDWLYATAGQEQLRGIEVYTFGSAANHFNSPQINDGQRVIKHIEHYANLNDYVSRFGILHFRPLPWKFGHQSAQERQQLRSRYVGRLFVRKGSGHQLNGNYLDNFFDMAVGPSGRLLKVKENNETMDEDLNGQLLSEYNLVWQLADRDVYQVDSGNGSQSRQEEMKNVSRLWRYKNGLSPSED